MRQAVPGVAVSASWSVLPEMKEYERTSTTVVNGYLLPAMQRYLADLTAGLARSGVRPRAGGGLQKFAPPLQIRYELALSAALVALGVAYVMMA